MADVAIVFTAAFILDLLIGDPEYPLHPVRLLGRMISFLEKWLFKSGLNGFTGGVILLLSVVVLSFLPVAILFYCFAFVHSYAQMFLLIYVFYSSFALRDLFRHPARITRQMKAGEIVAAKEELQMIVGRDVKYLDENGIARATIESISESLVDSLISPFFWFTVGYLLGLVTAINPPLAAVSAALVYRCVNTLDSMVGYKNEKYLQFGKASARSDDFFNFLPARLSLFFLSLAALLSGNDALNAWKIGWRDRLKHKSPNAGHPEAAMAGALKVKLGGPTRYSFGLVEKPFLGSEFAQPDYCQIKKSIIIACLTAFLAFSAFSLILILVPVN